MCFVETVVKLGSSSERDVRLPKGSSTNDRRRKMSKHNGKKRTKTNRNQDHNYINHIILESNFWGARNIVAC